MTPRRAGDDLRQHWQMPMNAPNYLAFLLAAPQPEESAMLRD
jgi:hypothetical protein